MDFLRTKHYSWHTYGDSQWNKTLLRLYWVAFEGSFWLLSIICATENRRLDEYELQVVSWRHALSSAHSKIYQEILREVQSKTVCRDFMQLEHICLPPTVVLWILCACFWSDVSPHRCLVAESCSWVFSATGCYISDFWTWSDTYALLLFWSKFHFWNGADSCWIISQRMKCVQCCSNKTETGCGLFYFIFFKLFLPSSWKIVA